MTAPTGDGRNRDAAEATGWAAEIERLAGRSWMALRAGEAALGAASHYLDPAEARERQRRLAEERAQTVDQLHRLAHRKMQALQRHLAREGVAAYIGSRCYLEAAHLVGIRRGVVSASANTIEILERAGLAHLIDHRIDAEVIDSEQLAAKPAPD